MEAMSRVGAKIEPNVDAREVKFHECKYAVFKKMYSDQLSYRELMSRQ
jgi:hypothetical protein